MRVEQSTRLAIAFARQAARGRNSGLCHACVEVLRVDGVGITVMGGGQSGPMCTSNRRVEALEELQFTTGEGPCQDAFRSGRPVRVVHLDLAATTRWPSFVGLAKEHAIGAVFAYPLSTSGAKVGVMSLYQGAEGELSVAQYDDSAALVEVLTETVLSLQDGAPAGSLSAGLDDSIAYRAEIYEASGMVAVQLRIPVSEALLRIRAHAFVDGRTAGSVAADIVNRQLRLSDHSGPDGDGSSTHDSDS